MGNSKELREQLCEYFKIGYCNSKQFVNRLNSFGITEEELIFAVENILGRKFNMDLYKLSVIKRNLW